LKIGCRSKFSSVWTQRERGGGEGRGRGEGERGGGEGRQRPLGGGRWRKMLKRWKIAGAMTKGR